MTATFLVPESESLSGDTLNANKISSVYRSIRFAFVSSRENLCIELEPCCSNNENARPAYVRRRASVRRWHCRCRRGAPQKLAVVCTLPFRCNLICLTATLHRRSKRKTYNYCVLLAFRPTEHRNRNTMHEAVHGVHNGFVGNSCIVGKKVKS